MTSWHICDNINDMQLVRTTLRIRKDLKKLADNEALNTETTLQELFNKALESYLTKTAKAQARKIVFRTHDLGEPLDNLTRADYYGDP